jgi:hypothetical protein
VIGLRFLPRHVRILPTPDRISVQAILLRSTRRIQAGTCSTGILPVRRAEGISFPPLRAYAHRLQACATTASCRVIDLHGRESNHFCSRGHIRTGWKPVLRR